MRCLLGICLLAQGLIGCGSPQPTFGAPPGSTVSPLIRPSVTYGVLYSFTGHQGRSGGHPSAPLINVDGTFYGTTSGTARGLARYGTVFSITISGVEKPIVVFKDGPKGATPGDLIDIGGTLFGTTAAGGSNGLGTVFSMTRAGRLTTLHSFSGGSGDGARPNGLVNVDGTLYGTTSTGGTHGDGTVFSITPSGTETVLYNFAGSPTDGAMPVAPLIDVQGTLYGTTANAGKYAQGTVFKISPSGKETVLYSFRGGTKDGAGPLAALVDVHGVLYSTTWSGGSVHCGGGCGTVFAITPAGKERIFHVFQAGTTDGAYPNAAVVGVDGTLYGTTSMGGANGVGTVFAITSSRRESVLHSFGGGADGVYPEAALHNTNGTLYGTTFYGGSFAAGTVFALTP